MCYINRKDMSNDTGQTKARSGQSWEFVWIGPIIKLTFQFTWGHSDLALEHLTLSVVNGLSQCQQYSPKCKLLADGIQNSSSHASGALLSLQSTFPNFQIFFCCLPHATVLSASTIVNWFLSVIWRMVLLLWSLFTAHSVLSQTFSLGSSIPQETDLLWIASQNISTVSVLCFYSSALCCLISTQSLLLFPTEPSV